MVLVLYAQAVKICADLLARHVRAKRTQGRSDQQEAGQEEGVSPPAGEVSVVTAEEYAALRPFKVTMRWAGRAGRSLGLYCRL